MTKIINSAEGISMIKKGEILIKSTELAQLLIENVPDVLIIHNSSFEQYEPSTIEVTKKLIITNKVTIEEVE